MVEVRAVAGELLCVLLDGSITATPFDVRHHRITGAPVQIGTGVSLSGTGIAHFAVADNGTIVYVPEAPRSLVLVDRNGAQRPALEERLSYHAPKFSPDGSRISFDLVEADGRDVWTLALAQHTLSRATFAHDGHDATWTPDSRFLTYVSFKSGVFGLYRTRPGSTAPAESLLTSARLTYPGSWLADGSALVTTGTDLQGQSSGDIAIVRNGGHGPIEPLVASPFQESYAALSPDGRWLAFASDQSGRQEIYVQPLHDPGDQVQVSQDGGTEAVWGRDGRELFYRGTHGSEVDLVDATVRTTPEFSVTARHTMFSLTDMAGAAPHANFDISPDGRTFVMVRRSPSTRINVIQNLPVLLRGLRGIGSKE